MIFLRVLLQRFRIHLRSHVDGCIADRVQAELPSVLRHVIDQHLR